ncbi:xanthine dehydrogenase family protein molybdopterin-binding subunit [Clostridium swellfunianum]|uniref:xanthine dehydrogenase family protein molybdopterin-binding subunit n=1 Tax=Clostridium swellfunianum TaxID=1367462 RepID=UPI00202FF069|nr:molybdopterin cofactor-binding domain-containing protein [Clostridium swellfunianum]
MKKIGVGYGCMIYGTGYGNGFPDESRATAELNSDGTVTVYVEVTDVGQGGKNIMSQIASEALNMNLDYITIKNTNTAYMRDSGTAAASRQTYNTGNAVLDACKKLRQNIDNCNIENFKIAFAYMRENNISLKAEGYFKANTTSVNLETGEGNPYWPYTFSVNKAVVEVDDETGKVNVLEITACHDSGKIVNPLQAEGQIQGGCAMGLGYGIMEEIIFSKGVIKNSNFNDYIIPTSKDVPKIKTIFVEEIEDSGPYGAKGLGEPSMIATAPAIINAIYDAVGVRIYDLPASPDKVMKELVEKRRSI